MYTAYLEVANTHPDTDPLKIDKQVNHILSLLARSMVQNRRILDAVLPHGQYTVQIPDYGHNYACKCRHPERYGVTRLFGLLLEIDGEPNPKLLDVYKIGEQARLIVCAFNKPFNGQRIDLWRVDEET
jgi:hypothetical protein